MRGRTSYIQGRGAGGAPAGAAPAGPPGPPGPPGAAGGVNAAGILLPAWQVPQLMLPLQPSPDCPQLYGPLGAVAQVKGVHPVTTLPSGPVAGPPPHLL